MCDFCNNIKDEEWYKEHHTWDTDNAIVQTGEKTFGLWIDDWVCSGVSIKIKFCPICGRKLNNKEV